jgi:hypothetical protein
MPPRKNLHLREDPPGQGELSLVLAFESFDTLLALKSFDTY